MESKSQYYEENFAISDERNNCSSIYAQKIYYY